MAKRKSMNRRSSRYSRSSFGSGYLDPDTNIIDPDQPLWWNNLENNTINRLSMNTTHLVNYTNTLLNSNSTVRSMRGSNEWWKELEMTDSTVPIPPQDTPDTTKDATNDIADSSLSESEKDVRILRKKKPLRILPRRSQGNSAFLLALEHSKNLDASSSGQKDEGVKTPTESKNTASTEGIANEPLNENCDNSSNSGSVILKTKPSILQKAIRNNSDNVFHDLLSNEPLNEHHDNSSDSGSVTLKSKPRILQNAVHNHSDNVFQELLTSEDMALKHINDNHQSRHRDTSEHAAAIEIESTEHSIVNKSKTPQVHSLREPDNESVNLSTPNAHSSRLKSGHSSVLHSDDDDSKMQTNLIIPKSRFMRRTRKSSTTNIFENLLAAESNADTENHVEGVRRSARLTEARQTESSSKASNTLERSSISRANNLITQDITQSPSRNRKSKSLPRTKNKNDFTNASVPAMEDVSAEQEVSSPHTNQTSHKESQLVVADGKGASRINKSIASERKSLKRSSPTKRVSTTKKKRSSQALPKSANDESDSSQGNNSFQEGNTDVIEHESNNIELTHSNIPSPKRKRSDIKSDQVVNKNQDNSISDKHVNNPVDNSSSIDLKTCKVVLQDLANIPSNKLMTKHTDAKTSKKDKVIDMSIENLDTKMTSKKLNEKMTDSSFIKRTQFTDSGSDEEVSRPHDKSENRTARLSNLNTSNTLNKSDVRATSTLKTNILLVDTEDGNHISRVSKEFEKMTPKSNLLTLSRLSEDANAKHEPSRSEKSKSGTSKAKANASKNVIELFADSSSDEDILNITSKSSSRALSSNVSGISQASLDLVNNKHTSTPKKRSTEKQKPNGSIVKQVPEKTSDTIDLSQSSREHKKRVVAATNKSGFNQPANTEIAFNVSEAPDVEKETRHTPKLTKRGSVKRVSKSSPFELTQADTESLASETNVSSQSTLSGHDKSKSKKSKETRRKLSKSNVANILNTPPTSSGDTIGSDDLNAKAESSKLSITKALQTPPSSNDDKHNLTKSEKPKKKVSKMRVVNGSYSPQISSVNGHVSPLSSEVAQRVSASSPQKHSQRPSNEINSDPDDEAVFKVPQTIPLTGRRSSVQKIALPQSVSDDDIASVSSKNLQRLSPTSSVASSIRLRLGSDSETDGNSENNKGVSNTALKQSILTLKPTTSRNDELLKDDRQGRDEFSVSKLLPIAHSSGVGDSLVTESTSIASLRDNTEEKKTTKKQSMTVRFSGKGKDASVIENRSVSKKLSSTPKNIQDFLKSKQSKGSQPPSDGASSSQVPTEERLSGVKKELERIRLHEMEHMKMDKKPEPEKRVFPKKSILKKKILETKESASAKPTKEASSAVDVGNKVRKRPKVFRPKPWATDKLYHHLWKCMEPKYKASTKPRSEKFVRGLAEVIKIVNRRKKYDNYKTEVDVLMKEMARLKIIRTRNDFYLFCQEFLPFSFRIKVTPILLPGNKRTIPYDPSKLHTPIAE